MAGQNAQFFPGASVPKARRERRPAFRVKNEPPVRRECSSIEEPGGKNRTQLQRSRRRIKGLQYTICPAHEEFAGGQREVQAAHSSRVEWRLERTQELPVRSVPQPN